jgi:hypothetical protein
MFNKKIKEEIKLINDRIDDLFVKVCPPEYKKEDCVKICVNNVIVFNATIVDVSYKRKDNSYEYIVFPFDQTSLRYLIPERHIIKKIELEEKKK